MLKTSRSLERLPNTHAITRLGLAAVLALGCSATASATGGADSGVTDTGSTDRPSIVDVSTDSGQPDVLREPCNFQIEYVSGGNRSDYVSRDGPTTFGLREALGDCYGEMAADRAPEVVDGVDQYRFDARFCLYLNGEEQCQNTQLLYVPGGMRNGGNYKTQLSLGPVSFRDFTNVPLDWNATGVRPNITVNRSNGSTWYGYGRFNADFTDPFLSHVRFRVVGNTMETTFLTSEAGTWGLMVAGEDVIRMPRTGCDELEITSCGDGDHCVLNERGGLCISQPWGGQVGTVGSHTVTVPFTPTSAAPYRPTLYFQDIGGNTVSVEPVAQ